MTAKEKDLDQIIPFVEPVDVEGIPARVRRIKTRELIMLVRVAVKGFGSHLAEIDFDSKDAGAQGLALLAVAVPDAADELMEFFQYVVEPVDAKDAKRLKAVLANPEIESMLALVQRLVEQEWDDAQRLWGKAQTILEGYKQRQSPTGS